MQVTIKELKSGRIKTMKKMFADIHVKAGVAVYADQVIAPKKTKPTPEAKPQKQMQSEEKRKKRTYRTKVLIAQE